MKNINWIDREEYPFESHFLDLEMGRMHYLDEGAGPPLVMVHGNPTWSFLYRRLIRQLSPEFRCVALDHIGFGLSDKPGGWSYLPADHAQNLSVLIDSLELREVTLIVQDWGGPIGLSYAINHPENISRIVIMNTWMWPVDHDWYYIAFSKFTGGAVGRFLIRRYNFFARVIMRQSYGEAQRLTHRIHQHYLKPLEVPEQRKGCWVFPGQILGATEWLGELWAKRSLLADKPKLIAWGMKDIAFREKELNTWIAAFPDSRVIRLADVGHYVQEEAGDELGQAVRTFLAGEEALKS
jgi:haloalkane dehalogenase